MDAGRLYLALVDQVGEEGAKAWWKWLTVEWPGWAREGWRRVDAGRAGCAAGS